MGMSGLRASMIAGTCASTDLNGSMCSLASSMAVSILEGGCGPPVCGFIAFLAMYSTILLRLFSCMILRCSVVSWTSPLRMMVLATVVASVVPKISLILSSGARVPFRAFLKIVSMTMWSNRSTSLPSFIFWTTAGSMSISKLSPCDSYLAIIAWSRSTISIRSCAYLLHVRFDFGLGEPPELLARLDHSYLDGLRVEALLGRLRERLQAEQDRLVHGHLLLVLLLEDIHDGVLARAYRTRLVRDERAARVRLEQVAALVVHACH